MAAPYLPVSKSLAVVDGSDDQRGPGLKPSLWFRWPRWSLPCSAKSSYKYLEKRERRTELPTASAMCTNAGLSRASRIKISIPAEATIYQGRERLARLGRSYKLHSCQLKTVFAFRICLWLVGCLLSMTVLCWWLAFTFFKVLIMLSLWFVLIQLWFGFD